MPSSRIKTIDVAPNVIALAVTIACVLVLPHIGPQRLVVDRVRFYTIVAVASLLVVIAMGAIAVRIIGWRRPVLLIMTLASLPLVPFALTPVIEYFNARFDRSAPTSAVYQVRGYISNGRNLVSVRLKRIGEPPSDEISVANQYPFFDPQPPQGTFLRADLHRGGLGIAWISSLAAGNQPRE